MCLNPPDCRWFRWMTSWWNNSSCLRNLAYWKLLCWVKREDFHTVTNHTSWSFKRCESQTRIKERFCINLYVIYFGFPWHESRSKPNCDTSGDCTSKTNCLNHKTILLDVIWVHFYHKSWQVTVKLKTKKCQELDRRDTSVAGFARERISPRCARISDFAAL